MNILLESRAFYPSVGGIEMMSHELAQAWERNGHQVQVVTVTSLDGDSELGGLAIDRNPVPGKLRKRTGWADVFVQSGISLRSFHWPLLTNTPLVIIHHDLLSGQSTNLRLKLKRWATQLGANVAVSAPVADTVPGPVVRIPNTFRSVYDQSGASDLDRDGLLFVGRLVSVKGVDIAIEALRRLREQGIDTTLTICGDGPEHEALQRQVHEAGLEEAVMFEGWTPPDMLAEQYRQAELLLAPSRCEPFGIVALEAIASGCPVVASDVGGLPEAVGSCGLLVEPDTPVALAEAIEQGLLPNVRNELQSAMPAHVDRHRIDRIAGDYLHLLRKVVA